jgi:outer membrane immunogenic protein
MKRELLTATALSATLAGFHGGANAQTFNWTGIYIGTQAGAGWASDPAESNEPDSLTLRYRYGFAGVTGGINWNPGNVLLGFEADYSFFRAANSEVAVSGNTFDTELRDLLTIRARLGIARERLLLFATGGLAASNAHLSSNQI